jgi:uncharacterized protein YfaS (alpha-2-macroglobulin family)
MDIRHLRRFASAGLLVLAALGAIGLMAGRPSTPVQKETAADLWKKVRQAENDGLPQTAVESLKKIVALALEGKNQPEFLRALSRQVILESAVKGNKPENRVVRLKEEIGKAPVGWRPMMKLILAEWYWQYYSRNRWRFLNRSATEGLDEADFTTWDLPKLFREIDALYREVLKDESALKKTPLAEVKDFLVPGTQPASLRPTLFDFVVFEALDFYTSAEQAGAAPEDAFVIEADSAAFGPAGAFLRFEPKTEDVESPKLQALRLFQKVMAFHRDDADRDVFLDADLHRLRYVRSAAGGEDVSALYQKRLRELVEANPKSPFASLACASWADELAEEDKPAEAFDVANRGLKLHPDSPGAANCRAILARITAKEYDLRAETVIVPGGPAKLRVRYRNVTSLRFRAVKEDFGRLLSGRSGESVFWISDETVGRLLTSPPAAEWAAALEPTPDYRFRTASVDIPALKPGYYRILAGAAKDFAAKENKVQTASFWVSELGLVTRSIGGGFQALVVRNAGGEPVAGAEATLYEWDYGSDRFLRIEAGNTDKLGLVDLKPSASYRNRVVHVRTAEGAEVAEIQVPSSYRREDRPSATTVFFTDRSLYRPGQMIHFKGLCLSVDRARNAYELLPKRRVRVVLLDPNRQEAGRLDAVTNEFGSFSGTFTAPSDRLAGEMTIRAEEPAGSASVRVEEYKRPKFQVKLDVPDKEFRLNDAVEMPGEAIAYTGAPIDGASVRFRVVREVRYPWWFYWSGRSLEGDQEIAHGTLRTDEAGKFKVAFKAKPDPASPLSGNPVFSFAVSVDVTDAAGETRSDRGSVEVGVTSLEADLNAAEWQEEGRPVKITVSTSTLNGKKAAARGVVEVFSLKGPDTPVPMDLLADEAWSRPGSGVRSGEGGLGGDPQTSNWTRWPAGPRVVRTEFQTSATDETPTVLAVDLPAGAYRARLTTKDRYGSQVEAYLNLIVLKPAGPRFGVRVPFHDAAAKMSVEPGQTYELLWGTGYDRSPALVEVFQNNLVLERFWTDPAKTQDVVRVPVDETHRGGFMVRVSLIKENRLYDAVRQVSVPWSNKDLDLSWKTFRSKLQPGQKETWALSIKGPKAAAKAAEMAATLYDASLDQFYGHSFPGISGIFRTDTTAVAANFANRRSDFRTYRDDLDPSFSFITPTYVRFPPDIEEDAWGYAYPRMAMADRKTMAVSEAVPPPMPAAVSGGVVGGVIGGVVEEAKGKAPAPAPDLSAVSARKNLNETAFFFPRLLSDADGVVTLEFTMPEALTEWRFLGFAHTRDLESGSIESRTVTQKDLMVQPNPPRFLREGDRLEFTVKVTNMSETAAEGAVELVFFDPRTDKSLDAALGNAKTKAPFSIPAKQSRSFSWPIAVPDGLEVASFKAVAATTRFSDGEEGGLPVLSRRILVLESIPLWISGKGEKKFSFEKLLKSGASDTLRHQGLTLQMTSNPAWYAVQALPFLMEFPYECSEQVFNRLYANALAQKIAGSSPKIRRIFDLWKGTPALASNLEKNEDLKSILLLESPWVLEAKAETEAKRRVGLLFDENKMAQELRSAFAKLEAMQLEDGSWPWFPGGRGNSYITLYLLTGFGRLKHLGIGAVRQEPALKALGHLDKWIDDLYREILSRGSKDANHLSSTVALYLYGRSFYLKERPIPDSSREAVEYFLGQARRYWLELGIRQSQAHLALALHRFQDPAAAQKITRSLKERSQVDEELGRFWSELELSYWWFRAPIETQAVMIEAFDEVSGDAKAVEECKVWLLKQKQTQDWKTTKATADAVYALILRGTDLLASDAVVAVSLGGKKVEAEKVEAGTGFYEKRFEPSAVAPAMGEAVVTKSDAGIAWGGLHWQYLEDISKITPHAQNPLKLEKAVFVQRLTKKGPVIEPVAGPLAVGDTLVVRIELRTDRDMEYIHMKDHRGSGLEPVNVLSAYKYQGGLVYYESTKDTATHFFIDYLPKGTYVFEYPLKVVHRGAYQNGLAHIECMYAPEFNSHSESVKLEVR